MNVSTTTIISGGRMACLTLFALVGFNTAALAAPPATTTVTTVTASTTAASTTTTAATTAPAATKAPAAKPKPYVPPSDCGDASDELCGEATDADKDLYYTDSKSRLDCDDANATIHPFADVIIGDDVDNQCGGKDDSAELAKALEAAGGEKSAKGAALAADIDRCVNSVNEGNDDFVWKHEKAGYTCVVQGLTDADDKPIPDALPEGYAWYRGSGVLDANEQAERSSRIAGDRKAILEAKASAEASLKVVTETAAKAKDENKAWLEAKAKELDDKIAGFQSQLNDLNGEDELQNTRLGNLETRGMVFGVGATAQVNAARSYLAYEDGPVVRSGLEEIASATVLVGYEIPRLLSALTVSVGYGTTESNGSSVPVTAASAGISVQYRVPSTTMAIGPVVELGADSSGNVIVPQSSATDFVGGLVVSDTIGVTDLTLKVVGGSQEVCYNDFCDNGAIGKFSFTVAVRNHH